MTRCPTVKDEHVLAHAIRPECSSDRLWHQPTTNHYRQSESARRIWSRCSIIVALHRRRAARGSSRDCKARGEKTVNRRDEVRQVLDALVAVAGLEPATKGL